MDKSTLAKPKRNRQESVWGLITNQHPPKKRHNLGIKNDPSKAVFFNAICGDIMKIHTGDDSFDLNAACDDVVKIELIHPGITEFWKFYYGFNIELTDSEKNAVNAMESYFIYFIQCQDNGNIKIGRTKHLKQRIKSIAYMNPTEINVLKVIKSNNDITEKTIHRKFKHLKVSGKNEWFHPDQELIDFIKNIKNDLNISTLVKDDLEKFADSLMISMGERP